MIATGDVETLQAHGLRRVSEHLYAYDDTSVVYVLVDGEHALLIESGSGAVADLLPELGIRAVDWVLHTHHHRDCCWGDERLVEMGASLAVPEREAQFFEQVEDYWQHLTVFDNYYLGSDTFSLPRSVPVSVRLKDYGLFRWRGYAFCVIPAPGHTQGSIALLTEVDGVTVAFTGDLIAESGRLWQVHALQWEYGAGWGDAGGIQATALSLAEILDARPDLLLPSHGAIIEDPERTIGQLETRLRGLYRYLDGSAYPLRPTWLITERGLVRLSKHLWMNGVSLANGYTIVADDGGGLFFDCGYPSLSHFAGRFRFSRHSLHQLFTRAGLSTPKVLIPSHYHDDHIAGAPLLQREFGVEIWAHEVFTDILRRPFAYNLPCLLSEPLEVGRDLKDGERFQWDDFTFEIAHTPGHTHYASSILMEVDGLRAVLSGDTLHRGALGPLLGGPVYRNRFELDAFARSLEVVREWSPDLLLTGHSGAIQMEPAWLDRALRRAKELSDVLTSLVLVPAEAGFALDPHWVRITPYQSSLKPGQALDVTVHVTNHAAGPANAKVRLISPSDWEVLPRATDIPLDAGQEGFATFALVAPRTTPAAARHVVCADVELHVGEESRRYGPVAEAIVAIH